jgi:ribosomal protein L37E
MDKRKDYETTGFSNKQINRKCKRCGKSLFFGRLGGLGKKWGKNRIFLKRNSYGAQHAYCNDCNNKLFRPRLFGYDTLNKISNPIATKLLNEQIVSVANG